MSQATDSIDLYDERRGQRNLKILFWLITGAAAAVVGVSLWLYYSSGTFLLDLSRPRQGEMVDLADESWTFPAAGELEADDIERFMSEFSGMRGRINDIHAFTDQALSDETLGIK